jgi:hypothetical protein
MRVMCCQEYIEVSVPGEALLRSPPLSDVHVIDPEGWSELPCNRRTAGAWVGNDPTRIDDVHLLHDVVEVSANCLPATLTLVDRAFCTIASSRASCGS